MREERDAMVCVELSERVAQEARKHLGKRWRCPPELRAEIIAYATGCRQDGESLGAIAGRLRLVECTLARWLRKREKTTPVASGPGFRSVAIVPASGAPGPSKAIGLRLITTDGYIIEGLDIEGAAYLLRCLR